MQKLNIGKHALGGGQRCFVIGEVAQSHDGSVGIAHAFIDSIAKAGADAVKFQTHFAQEESSILEPWRVKFSKQDATRYDYWKRMEFTEEQWFGLKEHAEKVGLVFLSSPFSMKAVDLLHRMKMDAWKIASGEINNLPMLEEIAKFKKPVLLSTGMSPYAEIDSAVNHVKKFNSQLAVMQCTTSYPTPPEKVGLNLITEYRERYQCAVGLSDHSGTIYPGLAAATMGADVLEVHVALSREMFGPDVIASVLPSELKTMVEGIRFIETARANPIQKDIVAKEMQELRKIFNKSAFTRRAISAGEKLTAQDVIFKKPGIGILSDQMNRFIGKSLKHNIDADQLLKPDDFL